MHRHALLFVAALSLSACAGEISTFDPDTEGGTSEGGSGGGTEGGTSGPGTSGTTAGTSTGTSTSSGGSTSGGSTGGAATSTSSGGSTSGGATTTSTTGGIEKEKVYYECEKNADCPPQAPVCLYIKEGEPIKSFCTASCFYSYECPTPTTGDQVASCKIDLQQEIGVYFCFPSCTNGFECPVGMECFSELLINGSPDGLVEDVCAFPNN